MKLRGATPSPGGTVTGPELIAEEQVSCEEGREWRVKWRLGAANVWMRQERGGRVMCQAPQESRLLL
jgi:hypothetical protein